MKLLHRQKGVALITALMIVALASIISTNIVTKLQLDIRRTGNIIASDQAKLYAFAAEELAKRFLLEDRTKNNIDHLEEDWAQEYIFPLEEGTLQAKLTDLQACINLNSLVTINTVNPVARARLERLFTNEKLSPQLIEAIIDWIDQDVETTIPDGAEDGYYTSLERPYRNANTYLQSISELKLIKGFENDENIDPIKNSICAFGSNGATAPINVNTAPLEVLLSLSSDMDIPTAEDIIQYRIDSPFTSIDNFKSYGGLETIISQTQNLSVNTSYFMLETNIVIGDARVTMYSLLHRDAGKAGKTTVISRSQGVY